MDPTAIPLFALADQRLAWVGSRQDLLSQNVANADTPGYRAHDLLPFDQAMARAAFNVTPARTNPLHMAGTVPGIAAAGVALPGEQAPDGNSVSLDDQLERIADTQTMQELTTSLYTTYLGMFRTAIDR